MKEYKVKVVPMAKKKMRDYLTYLLMVCQREDSYEAVKNDYYETIDSLANVAGSLPEPLEPKLLQRGLKEIHFLHHKYKMLYRLKGDAAEVVYIFHDSEDYLNKLD